MAVDVHVRLPAEALVLRTPAEGSLPHWNDAGKHDEQVPRRALKRIFNSLHNLIQDAGREGAEEVQHLRLRHQVVLQGISSDDLNFCAYGVGSAITPQIFSGNFR